MEPEQLPRATSFQHFVEHFMLPNQPCLIGSSITEQWKARRLWQKNGRPDFEYMMQSFGRSYSRLLFIEGFFATCEHV